MEIVPAFEMAFMRRPLCFVSPSLSMHAPYVSALLFLLLLSFLPPAGVSAARIMHYTSVDLLLCLVDILR